MFPEYCPTARRRHRPRARPAGEEAGSRPSTSEVFTVAAKSTRCLDEGIVDGGVCGPAGQDQMDSPAGRRRGLGSAFEHREWMCLGVMREASDI